MQRDRIIKTEGSKNDRRIAIKTNKHMGKVLKDGMTKKHE
jgi:hypothetical protein